MNGASLLRSGTRERGCKAHLWSAREVSGAGEREDRARCERERREDAGEREARKFPPMPPRPSAAPVAHPEALDRAARLVLEAERPLVMLGSAASRPRLAEALSD